MAPEIQTAPLSQGVMLLILIGQGIIYTGLVWMVGRRKGATAEGYLTGGRDIGHGMIHSSVIAAWVWSASLMISSWTAYSYGFIGGWWYALGATLPLPIIGLLGKRLRHIMPKARSYVEFIKYRLDHKNHILITLISIIVSATVVIMIVTGASVMAVSFSNVPFWLVAALFILIFISYTSIAGLWASVFADTIMTLIMYAAIIIIVVGVYIFVGPSQIYDGLVNVMHTKPVLMPEVSEEIRAHQYDPLNWLNAGGIGFLIINLIGNLGAVICNQTYWARSIGSKDEKTLIKSFISGALCWFPIPLAVATALGLYGLSKMLVVGQTYTYNGIPMMFSDAEAVAPLSAFLVLGFVGLIAFVTAVIGASISTGAGEMLSVAICIVNDIYKGYLKKDANDKQILFASRFVLIVVAIVLYALVVYLRHIHFPFSGMYQAMGISFSSAVIPVCLTFWWKKTNKNGVFYGTLLGAVAGILCWKWTGFDMGWGVVYSNITVIAVSALIVIPWTLVKPEPFDYRKLYHTSHEMNDAEVVS